MKSQPKPVVIEEPVLIVEEPEQVFYEETIVEPAPPAVSEVEYWWDTPATNGSNGVLTVEDETTAGWLPEPEIRQRW